MHSRGHEKHGVTVFDEGLRGPNADAIGMRPTEAERVAWTHRWREADSNRRSLSQKRAGLSGGTGSAVEAKRGCVGSVIYQAETAGSIEARLTVAQPHRVAISPTPTRSRRSTALRHLSFVNRRAGKKRLGAPSPIPPNYRNLSRVALDRLVITEASTFTPPWRT